jgi:CRISPR-associated protein Cas6
MHWQEDESAVPAVPAHSLTDLSFALECRHLPVDHNWALAEAVCFCLPWLHDEPLAGVHAIHVAGSQNGWMRPEEPDALLHLSRRTRLLLRLPRARLEAARHLMGKRLQVAGHDVLVGEASEKPLPAADILYARQVASEAHAHEDDFLAWAACELADLLGAPPRKLLPGKALAVRTPGGAIPTRSLLAADLKPEQAAALLRAGLGSHRRLGLGLFIPHKGIKAVGAAAGGG